MATKKGYEEFLMKSIMSKTVVSFKEDDKLLTVAKKMAEKSISCAVIVDKKKAPLGIITERDLVKKIISKGISPDNLKAKDIMSKPVVSVEDRTLLIPAVHLMRKRNFRRLVITKKGKLVGIVTQTDITQKMITIIKHLNWQLISMEISVEDYIKKLKRVI